MKWVHPTCPSCPTDGPNLPYHFLTRLKRLVLGYQQLTSFVLSLDDGELSPPDGTVQMTRFNCTAINYFHRRAVKFQVDLPYNQEGCAPDGMDLDACFRPVANIQYLPDDLKVGDDGLRRGPSRSSGILVSNRENGVLGVLLAQVTTPRVCCVVM